MNVKKIITFMLSLCVATSFYGCNNSIDSSSTDDTSSSVADTSVTESADEKITQVEESEEDAVYKELGENIIMNIAGFDITKDEYYYYLYYAKTYLDGGDNSYWDENKEQKFQDLKDQTLNFLFSTYTVYKIAEDNGIELDDEDNEKISRKVADDIIYYEAINSDTGKKFEDYLKQVHCTEEIYKESYARTQLEYKTVAALYETDFRNKYFNDYICAKYILINPNIKYKVDEDNHPTDEPNDIIIVNDSFEYSDEEKAAIENINKLAHAVDKEGVANAIPELIDIIIKQLDEGVSFDELMNKYNMDTSAPLKDDGSYAGYYIDKNSMLSDFNDVAFSLEENEISDGTLFINGYGYFIIQRLPFDEDYLKDYLISIYMNNENYSYATDYEELGKKTQETMDVTFDPDYDKISIDILSN